MRLLDEKGLLSVQDLADWVGLGGLAICILKFSPYYFLPVSSSHFLTARFVFQKTWRAPAVHLVLIDYPLQ